MNCYTCFKYNYFSIKLKLRDKSSCLWSNFSVELPPVLVARSLATGADILVPEPGVVAGLPVVNKIGNITIPVRPLQSLEVEHWLGIPQDSVEPIAVIISRQFHPQSVHFQTFIGGQNKLVSSPEWISKLVSDRCLLGVKISLAGKTIFGVQSPIFLLFIIFVMVVHLESSGCKDFSCWQNHLRCAVSNLFVVYHICHGSPSGVSQCPLQQPPHLPPLTSRTGERRNFQPQWEDIAS